MNDEYVTNLSDKFEFPECWNNDVRMDALFAPFRPNALNPADGPTKMKFWSNLIERWCKHNNCPRINLCQLKNEFSRDVKVPACLEDVLNQLYRRGIIVSENEFIANDESWKSWLLKNFVKTPINWSLNAMREAIFGKNNQEDVVYIHLPVIKCLGEAVIQKIQIHQEKLIKADDLINLNEVKDAKCLSLILHWLRNEGLVAVHEENNSFLIKISTSRVKPVKITEIDLGIYNLEKQRNVLQNNIKQLESEKNAALENIKKQLSAGLKNMAKLSLRKKKEIERIIEKRTITLENINSLLNSIYESKLDSDIIECYQKGIVTLRSIFRETGLDQETVVTTMGELEDLIKDKEEIEKALATPLEPVAEQSLEDELNELLLQEAPQVPTDDIVSCDENKKAPSVDRLKSQIEALNI